MICKAFGVSPRHVSRLELVTDARDAVRVTITRFVSDSEVRIIGSHATEFCLMEREELDRLRNRIYELEMANEHQRTRT